jgi:Na+-translocating ferredoxin:NAD+ oxidoreductase subunit B
MKSCATAVAVGGGGKGCTWGCVGLADCAVVCDPEAIEMNVFGLPVVDPEKCTACGDCVEACPLDLFTLMPLDHKLVVQCRSLLQGDAATEVCAVACDACGKCAADAPDLIEMRGGLPVIAYDRFELATPAAAARCPTGAILWVEGRQFEGLDSGSTSQDSGDSARAGVILREAKPTEESRWDSAIRTRVSGRRDPSLRSG